MKRVILSFSLHIILISIFAIIYYAFGEKEFVSTATSKATLVTFLNLATTIQAGVGFSTLLPNTELLQFIVMVQQLIGLGLNVFIYWFLFR